MGANQDILQAGFVPTSSHDEIRLPRFGVIDLAVAGFVPGV